MIIEKAILVFGPSGAGKSFISAEFAREYKFLHYEADRWPEQDGIDFHNLRTEWELFITQGDPKPLYEIMISRARAEKKNGAILSLPSMIPNSGLLLQAKQENLHSIILYGSAAECIESFLKREMETGRNLSSQHWYDNNCGFYMRMSSPEFAPFRVLAFNQGKRKDLKGVLAEILGRIE